MYSDRFSAFLTSEKEYLKNVVIDNVIFGYDDKELKVLLQKPFVFEKWTVTGGYIKRTESIEEAADRIAFARTGLTNLYLKQYQSFGNPNRRGKDSNIVQLINKAMNIELPADFWIFDYFVSVGFYTLTKFSSVQITNDIVDEDCAWWPIHELPEMMFDHKFFITAALRALRLHMAHFPIGHELLPKKFTLPEIHKLYETILGKSLDSRNFSKRLLSTEIIEKLDETKSIGAHRSPFLYKFNKKKYEEGLKNGVALAF